MTVAPVHSAARASSPRNDRVQHRGFLLSARRSDVQESGWRVSPRTAPVPTRRATRASCFIGAFIGARSRVPHCTFTELHGFDPADAGRSMPLGTSISSCWKASGAPALLPPAVAFLYRQDPHER